MKNLHVRLVGADAQGLRVRLRRGATNGAIAEFDLVIPTHAIYSLDMAGKLVMNDEWLRDNFTGDVLDWAPAADAPKVSPMAADRIHAFRKLMLKYHPDSAPRGSLFTPAEIASDLNALRESFEGILRAASE